MSTPTASRQQRETHIKDQLEKLTKKVELTDEDRRKFYDEAKKKLSDKAKEIQDHYKGVLGDCCSEKKNMYDTVMNAKPGQIEITVPDLSEIRDLDIEKLVCDPNTGKTVTKPSSPRSQTTSSLPAVPGSASATRPVTSAQPAALSSGRTSLAGPASQGAFTAPVSQTQSTSAPGTSFSAPSTTTTATSPGVKPAAVSTAALTNPMSSASPGIPAPLTPTAQPAAAAAAGGAALTQKGGIRELVMRRYF